MAAGELPHVHRCYRGQADGHFCPYKGLTLRCLFGRRSNSCSPFAPGLASASGSTPITMVCWEIIRPLNGKFRSIAFFYLAACRVVRVSVSPRQGPHAVGTFRQPICWVSCQRTHIQGICSYTTSAAFASNPPPRSKSGRRIV
jgi:hypothetical protein